jgi:hypothetical protein
MIKISNRLVIMNTKQKVDLFHKKNPANLKEHHVDQGFKP